MEENGRQTKTVRVPRTQSAGWKERESCSARMSCSWQEERRSKSLTGSILSNVRITSLSMRDWVSSVSWI